MSSKDYREGSPYIPDSEQTIDQSKRELLKRLATGTYVAPVALAMMTTKASACSLSC